MKNVIIKGREAGMSRQGQEAYKLMSQLLNLNLETVKKNKYSPAC